PADDGECGSEQLGVPEADVVRADAARRASADRDALRVGAVALDDPGGNPEELVLGERVDARLGVPGPLRHAEVAEPVGFHRAPPAGMLDGVADTDEQPAFALAAMLLDRENAGQAVAVAQRGRAEEEVVVTVLARAAAAALAAV